MIRRGEFQMIFDRPHQQKSRVRVTALSRARARGLGDSAALLLDRAHPSPITKTRAGYCAPARARGWDPIQMRLAPGSNPRRWGSLARRKCW